MISYRFHRVGFLSVIVAIPVFLFGGAPDAHAHVLDYLAFTTRLNAEGNLLRLQTEVPYSFEYPSEDREARLQFVTDYFGANLIVRVRGAACDVAIEDIVIDDTAPKTVFSGTYTCADDVRSIADITVYSDLFTDLFRELDHSVTISVGETREDLLNPHQGSLTGSGSSERTREALLDAMTGNARSAFGGERVAGYLRGILRTATFEPVFIALSLLVAVLLGALHALTPGHGKTMVAAYLVGSKGRVIDAIILGAVVTLTHTASVLFLGLLALFASKYILPQVLLPWFSLFSGLLIFALGIGLFLKRVRSRGVAIHQHAGGYDHDHEHSKDYGSFWQRRKSEVSFKQLVTLGVSGGLLPCPDALAVLVVAISLNRIVAGLAMVIAFSVGVAAALIALGILMTVAAIPVLSRHTKRGPFMKLLPIGSALIVATIGLLLSGKALLLILPTLKFN